jgi:hypothetical protein
VAQVVALMKDAKPALARPHLAHALLEAARAHGDPAGFSSVLAMLLMHPREWRTKYPNEAVDEEAAVAAAFEKLVKLTTATGADGDAGGKGKGAAPGTSASRAAAIIQDLCTSDSSGAVSAFLYGCGWTPDFDQQPLAARNVTVAAIARESTAYLQSRAAEQRARRREFVGVSQPAMEEGCLQAVQRVLLSAPSIVNQRADRDVVSGRHADTKLGLIWGRYTTCKQKAAAATSTCVVCSV